MGHSFGGLVTQILLDRGLGSAGVAIDPAPPKGVLVIPPASLKVASVALRNPANRHRAQMLTAKQFRYAFGNTLSEAESQAVYERYAVPGPGRTLFQAGARELQPQGRDEDRLPQRRPRTAADSRRRQGPHGARPASTRANYKLQSKSKAVTEYKEYPERSHWTCGRAGLGGGGRPRAGVGGRAGGEAGGAALTARGQRRALRGTTAWARNLAAPVRDFLSTETGGAVALLGAAVAALVWANSPWSDSYESAVDDRRCRSGSATTRSRWTCASGSTRG